MARRSRHAPLAVLLFVLASPVQARFMLKGSAPDFNKQLETAHAERDVIELQCASRRELNQVAEAGVQTRLARAGGSLQAAATAEVQLKAHQGTLTARATSIETRRDELRQICSHLDEGRGSQGTLLKDTSQLGDEVMGVVAKMQGDYSAKMAKIQGSLVDQGAWIAEGKRVCGSQVTAVDAELNAARKGIQEVEHQLKLLDANRKSAEDARSVLSQDLIKLHAEKGVIKAQCDWHKNFQATRVQQLQASRAAAGAPASVSDCEVSDWHHGDCSKKCDGGTKPLTRDVVRQAAGGAACPKLATTVACNTQACEVSCHIGAWSVWTPCSRICNGGHKSRNRTVVGPRVSAAFLQQPVAIPSASAEMAMFENDGAAACGLAHEVQSCNAHACGSDCSLGEWGSWGPCTKACGGGRRGRQRLESLANHSFAGSATCKGWQKEFSSCKAERCPPSPSCGARQDMIIMVDGSELLAPAEFETQRFFVKELMGRFKLDRTHGTIAGLVLYGKPVPEAFPLTDSEAAIEAKLQAASIGRGGMHLDRGLNQARAMFVGWSARRDAPKTAIILLDGKPDSIANAVDQAAKLKELGARVIVVAMGECIVNKNSLEQIASEPAAENLFYFKTYQELRSKLAEQVVSFCPSLASGYQEKLPTEYLPKPASNKPIR